MVDANDDESIDPEDYRALHRSCFLLREETSALREMLEGAFATLKGAQRAYAAVSQHVDLLSVRVERAEAKNSRLAADKMRMQLEIDRLSHPLPGE